MILRGFSPLGSAGRFHKSLEAYGGGRPVAGCLVALWRCTCELALRALGPPSPWQNAVNPLGISGFPLALSLRHPWLEGAAVLAAGSPAGGKGDRSSRIEASMGAPPRGIGTPFLGPSAGGVDTLATAKRPPADFAGVHPNAMHNTVRRFTSGRAWDSKACT